MAEGRWRAIA
ncbi:Protein of unknown function [Bacillus mycoides]|nr:Protein of unknown function [Bacillus mycoides]